MVYKSTSIDPVIGKIIRDTRVQDASYLIDMHEWIPEVMAAARYEAPLNGDWVDVPIHFHKGRLPCGLIYIDAVEWEGHRLAHGNSVKNIRTSKQTDPTPYSPDTYTSVILKTPTPDGNGIYFSTLRKVQASACNQRHYYQLELDYILTSFETGCVRVYYRTTPHDERGLPLIPDNQAFREAIYYYVRAKMIGAGYQDKVFKEETCYERHNHFLERALCEIDFPSPDMMEERVNTFARFIPPENYYNGYFRVAGKEPFYDPMGPYDSYFI